MVAIPLHRLDCCVVSDGGGAVIVARPEIAKALKRPRVTLLGAGEAIKHARTAADRPDDIGRCDRGTDGFEEAGVTPADIKYASIYDSSRSRW